MRLKYSPILIKNLARHLNYVNDKYDQGAVTKTELALAQRVCLSFIDGESFEQTSRRLHDLHTEYVKHLDSSELEAFIKLSRRVLHARVDHR